MATTASLSSKAQPRSGRRAPGPDRRASLKLLIELQRKPIETLRRLSDQYGSIVKLKPGLSRLWIISDPQYLQRPLYENAANYARAGLFRSLKPALGDGLMVSSNDDRDGLHELLSNAFQPRRLKQISTTVQGCVQRRATHWQNNPATRHDLVAEMQQLSLDIICQLLFGRESSSISRSIQPLLATAHQWMDDRSDQVFNTPGWLPSSPNRQLKAAMQELDQILSASLEHARPRMRDADTLLDLLTGLRMGNGESLPPPSLLNELRGLLLLAQRNLASALFSSSWLLANDAGAQRLVDSEAATILQRGDDDVRTQAAYSRMVVEESLRLYPPTWAFSRQVLEDDTIGDYTISAGSLILIPNQLVHKNSSVWPEPSKFQPDRFSAVNRVNRQRGAWLPFGAGPMQCVGDHLSIAVLQLSVLHMAGLGKWQLESSREPEMAANLVLEPKGEVNAHFVSHCSQTP